MCSLYVIVFARHDQFRLDGQGFQNMLLLNKFLPRWHN